MIFKNIVQKGAQLLKTVEKELPKIPLRKTVKRKTVFNFSSVSGPKIHTQEIPENYKPVEITHQPDNQFENQYRDKEFKRVAEGAQFIQLIFENDSQKQKIDLNILKKNLSENGKSMIDLQNQVCSRKEQQKILKKLGKNQVAIIDGKYGILSQDQKTWDKSIITPTISLFLKSTPDIKDNNIYYPEKSQQESIFHSIRDFTLYQEIYVNDDQILEKIAYLANLENLWYLLDTRRITSLPKQKMRPLYNMWHARINSQIHENPFSGQKLELDTSFIDQKHYIPYHKISQSKCHFDHIDKIFNKNGFSVPRHVPYVVDKLENLDSFEAPLDPKYLHQDMAIKMPGTDYRVPEELGPVAKEFTEKVAQMFKSHSKHHDDMYAYLTVSNGIQQPFLAQRRPGMHADGFKSYLTHEPNEINDTVFIACNAVCPVFYIEDFPTDHLDPGEDDLWCNFSSQCKKPYWDGLRPYEIAMIDGFNLHSVAVNKSFQTFQRIFIRIMYSVSKYDRLGNLKNPLFDYNWDMKPQPIQMPPVFWNQRQPQYERQKEQNVDPSEKVVYYSDGLWEKVEQQ